jgi:hypothetical protein
MRKQILTLIALFLFVVKIETVTASEFQPLGKAIATVLGTSKALKHDAAFYAKDAQGKASRIAFVEKRLWGENCTHTWVVGVDAAKSTITGIEAVEMSCPHAFPTKASSYLEQYIGKGPTDVATLDKTVDTIAKATGSSRLCTDAVKHAITEAGKLKGKI